MTRPPYNFYRNEQITELKEYCQKTGKVFEKELALLDLKESLDLLTASLHIGEGDKNGLEALSYNIANTIMTDFVIKKGNVHIELLETEFYFFNKDHNDCTTYVRDMDSGRFFFHASGVDITFKSNIERNEKGKIIAESSTYGGLLIRSLRKKNQDNTWEYVLGPHKCVDYLWDSFNALSNDVNDYPILEFNPIKDAEIVAEPRHIPIKEDKKEEKLRTLNSVFETPQTTPDEFEAFLGLNYRFVRNGINIDSTALKTYSGRQPSPCPKKWQMN